MWKEGESPASIQLGSVAPSLFPACITVPTHSKLELNSAKWSKRALHAQESADEGGEGEGGMQEEKRRGRVKRYGVMRGSVESVFIFIEHKCSKTVPITSYTYNIKSHENPALMTYSGASHLHMTQKITNT